MKRPFSDNGKLDEVEREAFEAELQNLEAECERRDIRLTYVESEALADYIGMNSEAAKALGYPYPAGDKPEGDWILVDESLHLKNKVETLRHELFELGLMQRAKPVAGQVKPYFPAHLEALKREHFTIPKPKKQKKKKRFNIPIISSLIRAGR